MTEHEDAQMFARLRTLWGEVDPMPAGLIDRMVAAVAADGLNREYALLTLVEGQLGAVRGEADALTLQFSDGSTSILLHVTTTASGRRRVDGWVDTAAAEIVLTQGEKTRSTSPEATGRFVFDEVPPGLTRVRLTTVIGDETRTLSTPQFEL
ncbi:MULTISPECIES: hypothetical protein [unclassified Microbacterium]|jgi:hypothetical protein|uniref:hypothetical protein n=1 Tax=unclassified Microbacterium TaxID=2609290 RepID=UPI000CFCE0C5|nr:MULTISPECIES: hypothetical protein [unclassified Microbacterium]PQZ55643.1 hypothetical protein CQ032_10970 [Microbacterium sp. MYb43]PQZ80975.1 hypothetical protein CQ031_06630 [Microbacterium sp. MYb40]PRB20807.1 hypothetical protein CQ040_10750 [Microbacterium sp. MYb54]PRB31868.1 hypothetical protein CQ037_00415 [Microbacterium sp. MYb50]PRB64516.1 hypothetical protein CQ021_14015 [Microbacterium sp. MYb24]